MRTRLLSLGWFLMATYAVFSQNALATGDATRGKTLSVPCAACHNADGNSTNAIYPKLAGQWSNYLEKSLQEYRALSQKDPSTPPPRTGAMAQIMGAQLATFSDADLIDLAAYFSQQTISHGETNTIYVTRGEALYRGGDLEKGITACAACHGPNGQGNESARFPKLSNQQAAYIEAQLHAFKDGSRKHIMMNGVAQAMSDDDMKAVSSFASGLH